MRLNIPAPSLGPERVQVDQKGAGAWPLSGRHCNTPAAGLVDPAPSRSRVPVVGC